MATLKSCNVISCVRVQIIVYMRETAHVLQELRVGEREYYENREHANKTTKYMNGNNKRYEEVTGEAKGVFEESRH